MTLILFTEEEKKWIIKEPFNWHVDPKAPEKTKKSLERKLKKLKEIGDGDIHK